MDTNKNLRGLWLRLSSRDGLLGTIAFGSAALMLVCMAWSLYDTHRDGEIARADRFAVERLRGRIVHFDEILTMSARMAVSEKDMRWAERYAEFEPKLSAAIHDIKSIESAQHDGGAEMILRTERASAELVNLEKKSLSLAAVGRFEEARGILFCDAYEEQKVAYIEGMDLLGVHLQQVAATQTRNESGRVYMSIFVVFAAIILTAFPTMIRFSRRRLAEQLETAETQLETASAESAKLSVAIEQSPVTVIITDANGTIEYINPKFTEVTGYTKEEAVGHNPCILNSGEWSEKEYEGLWQTILSGNTWRGEFRNRKKSGETYWESASISPIRNPQGEITHFLAVKEDITERKLREKELIKAKHEAETANRAKSEFLANMSHEIRTPMTAILGYAEMLEEDGDLTKAPPERLRAITAIRRNGDHLLSIINDILDLSKIDADKLNIKTGPCNVSAAVGYATDAIRPRVGAAVKVTVDIAPSVPVEFLSSDVRLRQILLNLVGNAAKFTEEGEISVVVRRAEDRILFDVSDTGCGMTSEQAATLFRPFQQIDNSDTRTHGGTGLGLTISKRLAGMLGGGVSIARCAEGEGCLFRLDLPCALVNRPRAAVASNPYRETMSGLRVLLVDDNEDNRAVIGAMLKRLGAASVDTANNGEEAIQAVMDSMFDVILMDMRMPVMNGYEATRVLRQGGYDGPVVAITGCVSKEDVRKCLEAGCDAHLPKPVTSERLMAAIVESCFVPNQNPAL